VSNALLHIPTSAAAYDAALEGLTSLDEQIIEGGGVDGAPFPPLYESGAVYKTEPREVWRHAQDVVNEGWGDCEDLAAYRAAELRVSGEDPDARVKTYQTGPRRYHAIVERSGGVLEDPSAALGMKIPANRRHLYVMDNTDGPEIMLGEDAGGTGEVSFDVYKHARGWSGVIRFPLTGLPGNQALVARTSAAPTQQAAAAKSVNLASQAAKAILSNPQLLQAAGPAGAAAAAVLTNPAAKAALKSVAQGAQGAIDVAKKLKFW
jgi:hypothetical protein